MVGSSTSRQVFVFLGMLFSCRLSGPSFKYSLESVILHWQGMLRNGYHLPGAFAESCVIWVGTEVSMIFLSSLRLRSGIALSERIVKMLRLFWATVSADCSNPARASARRYEVIYKESLKIHLLLASLGKRSLGLLMTLRELPGARGIDPDDRSVCAELDPLLLPRLSGVEFRSCSAHGLKSGASEASYDDCVVIVLALIELNLDPVYEVGVLGRGAEAFLEGMAT